MDSSALVVLVVGTVAVAAALALVAFLRRRPAPAGNGPELYILEEAVIVAPVAPGLAGRAKLLRRPGPASARDGRGGAGVEVLVRSGDASLAFARGDRVRLIDYKEGAFIIEPADAEHLVR